MDMDGKNMAKSSLKTLVKSEAISSVEEGIAAPRRKWNGPSWTLLTFKSSTKGCTIIPRYSNQALINNRKKLQVLRTTNITCSHKFLDPKKILLRLLHQYCRFLLLHGPKALFCR